MINRYSIILSSHSSSCSLLSFMIPLIAVSISERLRDRGIDTSITYDDFNIIYTFNNLISTSIDIKSITIKQNTTIT